MDKLLGNEVLCILLTLACYRVGLFCQRRAKSALFNPILIAVILVVLFMKLTGLDPETYQQASSHLSWLITPATVCLAIPMYEQLQILKKNLKAILAGVAGGSISCLAMTLGLCLLFRFDRELTVSLLPKSITSAIGAALSPLHGGMASVTTAVIILTGILAAMTGPMLCKLFRLDDQISQGVAMGTSGHVIATSRANEMSPLTGAVSSLSLVVAGVLTAILFPILV